ncbi:MAG: RibD family protein [Acidobacteria bacterium]|nr:RibD family protein [Acidobacteriota bacterium]
MRTRARPYCVLNVAVSLDGKIATYRREKFQFPSRRDRDRMDRLRAEADAILIGGTSLRVDDPPLFVRDPRRIRARVRRGLPPQPLGIVASRSLDLLSGSRFFREDPGRRIVVTVRRSPATRRRRLERLAEVWIAGERDLSPERLLLRLRRRGVRRLLLESGGALNHAFLAAGLIDEVYLTVCPLVISGSTAPTPFDGPGLVASATRPARLLSARRVGQELFLHYRLLPSRR